MIFSHSTHCASTDDNFQFFCYDQVCKTALAHNQVKTLLESFELFMNAHIQKPLCVQVYKLLQQNPEILKSCDLDGYHMTYLSIIHGDRDVLPIFLQLMFVLIPKHVHVRHFKSDHEGVLEFRWILIEIQHRLQTISNHLRTEHRS